MVLPILFIKTLAETLEKRRDLYSALFDHHLDETSLKEIREALILKKK